MPEFFLELFSEEIPARMQAGAAEELARICSGVFADLSLAKVRTFYGPRRIALAADIAAEKPGTVFEARGPRDTAPEAALAGFLGKYKAKREDVVAEGGYYWLRRDEPAVPAAEVVASGLPPALAKFSWPKSMRWGQSGEFAWVRPLRRIVCLLDGAVIPVRLGPVTAGDETEGHRFLSPGVFAVSSCEDWRAKLRARCVIADQDERRGLIKSGLEDAAGRLGLRISEDEGLLEEVNGLVEWPVALVGRIDEGFMELPPEVRELSMKVNQRYFALRDGGGKPAPYFAFVSNIQASDGNKAVVAGNERVLRARLSDARHFWELDLKTPLDELLPKLDKIVFHAKIGSQGERARRIGDLAGKIADAVGLDGEMAEQAKWAGKLSKADLVTGMVGEFPELQGVIGGYYAERNARGWVGAIVGPAIRSHYQPRGPSDDVPAKGVPAAVALADKLDTLVEFFRINEKPTGSGDPFALRRAALGIIRIILENDLHPSLNQFLNGDDELFAFIIERLRVKLKSEGERFDILDSVLAIRRDDDLVRIMSRVNDLKKVLETETGRNVLAAYRRAANILKIENAIDGPHTADSISKDSFSTQAEADLQDVLDDLDIDTIEAFNIGDFQPFLGYLSKLRRPLDVFFEKVRINAKEPHLRRSRLGQLALLVGRMHLIADFSKIEG